MNKILAICTSPDKGGLELYFANMVNHFHFSEKNIVAVCKEHSQILKLIKSPVIGVTKTSIFNIFYKSYKLSCYIDKENITVVHVSWTKDLFLAALIKFFSKKEVKIIYHRQMKITRYKKDFYHNFIYKSISVVLVITKGLLIDCKKYLPIDNNKIIELPYGISLPDNNKTYDKKIFLNNLGLKENIFTIGVFSRIEEQKGQHLVIEALNLLSEKDIQLVVVGHCMDSGYQNDLIQIIDKYNMTHQVAFTPFIESPMKLMGMLDLIILPTYEETFGLVVAESMLMGTPVIGSNAGGVPEIIHDNHNGLLFESKNYRSLSEKIISIYKSEELRIKLSNNAKIFANEHYDYHKHFSKLENIMQKL
jgi:L-malate glycosyltransferase